MTELDDALALALAVAAEAADLLRGARPAQIRSKTDPRDLVTEWDLRSEELIRAALARATPDIPVVGEEAGGDEGAARRWLVDPIDGTVNFAHGLPIWSIAIALERGDDVEVGVVCAPALGWTYAARLGGGARLTRGTDGGGEALAVSAIAELASALLVTGFPYDRATSPDNNFAEWEHFQRRAGAVRRLGAASLDLCLVAAGSFDGYWERKLHPWDCAAGALLVSEAGGRVTDTLGGRFRSRSGEVVASNGAIHDAIVAELAVVAARREHPESR
jgi:myo-inositol-1(or 4)-monophosphatase